MSRTQPSLDRRKPSPISTMLFVFVAFLLVGIPGILADKTAADYFVHSLPGQPDGPLLRMHAGHIEITPEHNGNLFFWHYQNRHIADRPRTVIWLNGGPGCSSEDGGLMELGPYRVGEGGKLRYNDGSWDEFANILFVDNPVGTGFSYVNGDAYLHELQEMADQFIVFLEKWFTLFPEYEHDDLYIAGESYAGQHIPYIAKAVQDRNAKLSEGDTHRWNMKGLLIGNGWISPVHQYQAYASFAYDSGLIQGGTPQSDALDKSMSACLEVLNKPENQEKVTIPICENVLSRILDLTKTPQGQCINMYDIRLTDDYPSCGMNWPPDLETVTPYLRRTDVVEALHINKDKREGWSECSGAVSSNFRAANSKPSVDLLPGLLESGLPIVLFSGDKDMICNHIGTEDMIADMKWSGGQGFETAPGVTAPRRSWEFEKQPAGIYQEARNLTYVKFYNSSHMVPFDYPRRSRDMLDRFMGVDIASIGGVPADSRLDGEKAGSETSVGGHTNSTTAIEEEKARLRQAELKAYYRSGEAALVFVIIAASIFGWWVWRQRRKSRGWANQNGGLGSYMSVPGSQSAMGLNGSAINKKRAGDIEAGDFDENELDNLHSNGKARGRGVGATAGGIQDHEPYDLASDSEDEDGGSDVEKDHRRSRSGRNDHDGGTGGTGAGR